VRRSLLLALALMMCPIGMLSAGTFEKTPLAPEVGLDVLTRRVTREQICRELFANPYATVTIANVDVYDRFPYVETRHFQVVSDPRWDRVVYGERGRSLRAYDGKGGALGALSGPRGMAADERNRVYVADTGNDRVVVLQATTELAEITLVPLYAIEGLGGPHDVAYSDGGTPFVVGDDYLYVAETGRNRVAVLALEASGARVVTRLGDLGSGVGRFAGPMAVAAGRSDGVNTRDLYVADAHNRRIVHLRHEGSHLRWIGETRHEASILTSLATDQWGNVYAASPQAASVSKFSPALVRVAELTGDLSRPRSFHVPFVNIHDHRDGSVTRAGQPNGVSVDQWSDRHGVGLWKLGVELSELAVQGGDHPVAHFTLTDRAAVRLEISDASSGRMLASRPLGALAAGLHTVPLAPEDLMGAGSGRDLVLKLSAVSSYANGPSDVAQTRFQVSGQGEVALPNRPILMGSTPNPMSVSTRIAMVLPALGTQGVTLGMFDASGRRLRTWRGGFSPGLNEVEWDGTDDHGRAVRAGVYFYRLELGAMRETGRIALVR
jgi:hypothetical protein